MASGARSSTWPSLVRVIARARRAGELAEVLEGCGAKRTPVHALSLPSRHVLPRVRAFVDVTSAALAGSGLVASG